ncbi:MAG: threonine synthase [Thermoanaerobacteraceae bacterium]|nr:threonine synthase [Thermoanaerobacteraceae bacterium]
MMWRGIIEEYMEYMPISDKSRIITMLEGNTPLIYAANISKDLGVELYFKYDGLNPTGSFKDRGMTLAISKAVEEGAKAVVCASTGNTSASCAAYAAKAGFKAIVLIPDGKIAKGKLAQAVAYGANIFAVDGNFDAALRLVKEMASRFGLTIVNSLNPYRLIGQKSGAFEICDVIGCPEYVFIPVGNAGNISAYWMGFKEYYENGRIDTLPHMMGFQAAGAAPIVEGRVIENPETIATAIRIGNPVSWDKAVNAARESGGEIDKVTDEEILSAYRYMASSEGIFAEPASSASLAGLIKKAENGVIPKNSKVVCILTGNGLKDPDTVMGLQIDIKHTSDNGEGIIEYLEGIA